MLGEWRCDHSHSPAVFLNLGVVASVHSRHVVFPIELSEFGILEAEPPLGILLVPADGIAEALLEVHPGFPTELAPSLADIHGVTTVMSRAVFYVTDEGGGFAENIEDLADNKNVGWLGTDAEVIDFSGLALFESQKDTTAMVLHVDPVASLHAVTIYGQGDVVHCMGDHQRDEFLGELIGAIVIGTSGDDNVLPMGVMCGETAKVGGGLTGRVGRARIKHGIFARSIFAGDGAVDFICRDLQEAGDVCGTRGVEQILSAEDIGAKEDGGIEETAVHMAFRCEIQDGVGFLAVDEVSNGRGGDVEFLEAVARILFQLGKVAAAAGISEGIHIDDADISGGFKDQSDEVAADEPTAAGDQKFHIRGNILFAIF